MMLWSNTDTFLIDRYFDQKIDFLSLTKEAIELCTLSIFRSPGCVEEFWFSTLIDLAAKRASWFLRSATKTIWMLKPSKCLKRSPLQVVTTLFGIVRLCSTLFNFVRHCSALLGISLFEIVRHLFDIVWLLSVPTTVEKCCSKLWGRPLKEN